MYQLHSSLQSASSTSSSSPLTSVLAVYPRGGERKVEGNARVENGEEAAVAVEVSANLEIDAYNYHIVEDG